MAPKAHLTIIICLVQRLPPLRPPLAGIGHFRHIFDCCPRKYRKVVPPTLDSKSITPKTREKKELGKSIELFKFTLLIFRAGTNLTVSLLARPMIHIKCPIPFVLLLNALIANKTSFTYIKRLNSLNLYFPLFCYS